MQANELQDFACHGHGDLVGTLWGYLGQWTACARLLPPPLEDLLPFLGFGALGFLHRDTTPARRSRLLTWPLVRMLPSAPTLTETSMISLPSPWEHAGRD